MIRWSSFSGQFVVAMNRTFSTSVNRFNYAVAVTVSYVNYAGDAYSKTLNTYNKLEVAKIKSRNEIIVK